MLVDKWKTTVRRCCILTCCRCCLCLGKLHHCCADTGERLEKNLRLQIFYFLTFCCGQSHFNNDNEKTQPTIKNNFCNKRENPTQHISKIARSEKKKLKQNPSYQIQSRDHIFVKQCLLCLGTRQGRTEIKRQKKKQEKLI